MSREANNRETRREKPVCKWPDWPEQSSGSEFGASRFTQNEQLVEALNAMGETFALWGADHTLVHCNKKFRQIFRLDEKQACIGASYEDVMCMARLPEEQSRFCVNQEVSGWRHLELGFADGVWLQYSEKKTREGGLVCIGTDITFLKEGARKLADHESKLTETVADLRRSRHELERQTQKLVDLTEKYATEKRNAESANHAKSQFLANISHELRTPLNAVIGFSEIMRDEMFGPVGDQKYSDYARDIHESGKYLLAVINDILDMSKIEAGRMSLNTNFADAAEIVRDCMHIVESNTKEARIELKKTGPASLLAWVDERAFKQILLNLLSNAIKFTPAGGEVCAQIRGENDALIVAISDTGIGISSRALANLGRPFEQVENQFTKSHNGTGLGLAISRSLVEMHGGTLQIESSTGMGTTVTCSFPEALKKPDKMNIKSDNNRSVA